MQPSNFTPFVPAGARASDGRGGRLRVISETSTPAAVPGAFAPLATASLPSSSSGQAQGHTHRTHPSVSISDSLRPKQPPVLTLHRQGDRIVGIRIECGCGEIIELTCQY